MSDCERNSNDNSRLRYSGSHAQKTAAPTNTIKEAKTHHVDTAIAFTCRITGLQKPRMSGDRASGHKIAALLSFTCFGHALKPKRLPMMPLAFALIASWIATAPMPCGTEAAARKTTRSFLDERPESLFRARRLENFGSIAYKRTLDCSTPVASLTSAFAQPSSFGPHSFCHS
eukprot:CAMPEP_0176026058 /NCGR_PEP_ID=MMETSP0120_2-20121206/12759_1 /TAXON_ID=160619 /ORGANISM="Kryptoperidinium foliaceum, Strain CCMP 1326" /LENGTH=172 /DNA_ID=CAMNT_0017359251 /DNA_START=113 /DNA_END=631 /DNA_ORIENTATION=+